MKTYYARLEVVRMLRDPKYLGLAICAPIGFYLLFATLFGGGPTQPGRLGGSVEIMVAMASYGAIWAAISTTGPRLAEERQIGWLSQLRAMPLTAAQVIGAKVAASLLVALPAVVLVCVTAAAVKGVSLSLAQWGSLVLALWLGSAVFSVLGVAVGFAVGADAAYPVSYGLYMALSALGGLWVPPAQLPSGMKDVAVWLPTYHLADLGWRIAAGELPEMAGIGNLAGWAVALAVLALIAYRRPRVPTRRVRRRTASPAATGAGQ